MLFEVTRLVVVHNQTGYGIRHDAEYYSGGCRNSSSSPLPLFPFCLGFGFKLTGSGIVSGVIPFLSIISFIINVGGVLMSEFTIVAKLAPARLVEPAFSVWLPAFVTALLV